MQSLLCIQIEPKPDEIGCRLSVLCRSAGTLVAAGSADMNGAYGPKELAGACRALIRAWWYPDSNEDAASQLLAVLGAVSAKKGELDGQLPLPLGG